MFNILTEVKKNLQITGTYQDNAVQGYIDEVKQFLIDGGVSEDIVNSEKAIGIITRGVADLWNYGSGGTELSPYFWQRATQLAYTTAKKPQADIKFIKDYFYEMVCSDLNYENAYKFFKEQKPIVNSGGCSSVRNGNWYGRNLDWTYDENVEFLVRTLSANGRYASIGIASAINGLTNEIVKSKANNPLYEIVPFMLVDGINEKGVIVNTNVVPLDKGVTTKSVPTENEEVEICSSMLVRYILDHFETASEAVQYIKKHMSVYMPTKLLNMNYEAHYMVADENETYLVEFIGNEVVVENISTKPYMTNFYLTDVTFNEDGKVYTPQDVSDGHTPSVENNLTLMSSGLERYNYIVENYSSSNTKQGMRALMDGLTYTKAYKAATDPIWCSEFVGINNLTIDSPIEDYSTVIAYVRGVFDNRTRNGKTWQTTHSVVYDILNRRLSVILQEDGKELEFSLNEL